ncbi:MAG: M3 family metallopeptidase, partial [Tahibacter sp.]
MNQRLALALALGLSLTAPAFAAETTAKKTNSADAMASNPFFHESTLPFQYPPFDKIKDSDYTPAFERGMKDARAEVDKIADNKAAATFDNTIVAMEKAGLLLNRVTTTFFNLTGANTNDTLEKIQSEMAPKLSEHQDAIALNGKLFERVKSLYDNREKLGLDAESKRLVERYYTDFVRAGAKLSDADKTKLKAYNAELASLQTTFSQNLLKENNASAIIVDSKDELKGLSAEAIAAAAEAAKTRKLEGKYVIALQNTSGQPVLAQLENRALREKILKASLGRASHGGEFDNREVVAKVAKIRAERAALLGYANHAAYTLEDETAKTVGAVNKLLSELAPPAVANAKKEAADMQALID